MQRLWTCLLLAATILGTAGAVGNSSALKMRVIGGQVVTNKELGGYMVALTYKSHFKCGGTLIHERIVLTAAQCFLGQKNKKNWRALGNISSLADAPEGRGFKEYVISPDFNITNSDSDVALILLDAPLVGKAVGTLSLCSTKVTDGMQMVLSGWGLTRQGALQEVFLRSVTIPVIDWNKCSEVYRSEKIEIAKTTICAGVLGSKDACTFDSGGPLVKDKEVCGIVSFGMKCADHKFPGAYTDVLAVKPFIEKTMATLLAKN